MDIAEAVLARDAREEGKTFTGFHPHSAEILRTRPWPGNVRQLLNVIRNIVVLHDGPVVLPDMLPVDVHRAIAGSVPNPAPSAAAAYVTETHSLRNRVGPLVGLALADVERELIEATIEHCDGSIPRAAKLLAVSPSTVYRKLESWSGAPRRAQA